MTRHILIKSRSRLCGKFEFDIMNYCALNPFKLTKGLRNLFRVSFDKKFFIKRDRLGNIFSKADKKLSKVFNKKKSYYYNILILKKRIRFFFGVISDNFIQDQLFYIVNYKKRIKGLKLMDALARAFEMRIDFLILRLRYVFSLKASRDFVSSGLILVNGIQVFDYFFRLNLGDIVSPFRVRSKVLFYKSLYLVYFGEYVAKSGFLRGIITYSIFKFHLYRFRKKLFRRRLKTIRLLFKKSIHSKVTGPSYWFFILNSKYLQNWNLFSYKFSTNRSLLNFKKHVYFSGVSPFKGSFSVFKRFNFNKNKLVFIKNFNFTNIFLKNILKLKFNLYIFFVYYFFNSFYILYNYLRFKRAFIIFFSTIICVLFIKKYLFKEYLIKPKSKNFYKKILINLINLLKFSILFKFNFLLNNYNLFFNKFFFFKLFNNNYLLLNSLLLQKSEYSLNKLSLFNAVIRDFSFSVVSHLGYTFDSNSFSLFFFALRFTKRFFFSLKKSFFIKFFLFYKKFRNISWSFYILFLKYKIKVRLRKNKKFKGLKRFRKLKYKRVGLLDFLYKKRRLIRLWSIRLIERVFNLLQFFNFAVRKKLRFYKLRKREYSFFLMGKNYSTRRKFFKKYRRFTALNYIKYTIYRFNIFARKRFYRYNTKKMRKFNKRLFISKRKHKKGVYISVFNFFVRSSRLFLFKRVPFFRGNLLGKRKLRNFKSYLVIRKQLKFKKKLK